MSGTVLNAGDISIIGWRSSNQSPPQQDGFAIVLLKTIAVNSVVYGTNNGWLAAGGFRTLTETGTAFNFNNTATALTTTAPNYWNTSDPSANNYYLQAGTVLFYNGGQFSSITPQTSLQLQDGTAVATITNLNNTSGLGGLNTSLAIGTAGSRLGSQDQITFFQTVDGTATGGSNGANVRNITQAYWRPTGSGYDPEATNDITSTLPTGLTSGTTANVFSGALVVDSVLNTSLNGLTPTQVRSAVANSTNYLTGDVNIANNLRAGAIASVSGFTIALTDDQSASNTAQTLLGGLGNDALTGGSADDTIRGLNGDDVLVGNAGNDLLEGGDGNDLLTGGAGNDDLIGGAGIDTVSYAGAASAVTVSLASGSAGGGAGFDLISTVENILGSAFDDTLIGDGNANTIEGGAGNDSINGGAGVDTVSYASAAAGVFVNLSGGTSSGGAGLDTITQVENILGSAFNDTLFGDGNANTIEGGAGNDTINGGAGVDTVSYASAGAAVSVNLLANRASGGAGTDTITQVENIIGSAFADLLRGANNDNTSEAGAGYDFSGGGGGVDTVSYASAGAAVDVNLVNGSASGGAGNDGIAADVENIIGSAFNDTLAGSAAANTIEGLAGNDIIDGDGGFDIVSYASAASGVTVNLASGTATGGAGSDTLSNFEGIIGSRFADILTGDNGVNSFDGLGGGDSLSGGLGWDYYVFNSGDTIIEVAEGDINTVYVNFAITYTAGTGIGYAVALPGFAINLTGNTLNNNLTGNELANTLDGGAGNDTISGGNGNDNITGGADNDALYGEAGDDNLNGGVGNDFLDGGTGADSMTGGTGDETYYVDNAGDTVVEATGEGFDQVIATAAVTFALGAAAEVEVLRLATWLGDFAVTLTGNAFSTRITGGNLGDTLTGGTSTDFIDGGAGNDSIDGGDGNDFLIGGSGADTILGGNGADYIDGGVGADSMDGGAGSDVYFIDNAADVIVEAVSAVDYDRALTSVSYALGAAAEIELLTMRDTAASTNSTLTGNSFDQTIIGDAGNNTLIGGGGRDVLQGGAGADTFRLLAAADSTVSYTGRDWWSDWSQVEGDKIDVAAIQPGQTFIGTAGFSGVAGEVRYQTFAGYSTVFGDTNGDSTADWIVDINGTAALVAGDFIFV